MSFFDLPLDQLDTPDAGAPQFDFPGGAVGNGFQAADVAFQRRGVAQTAEFVEHLGDAVVLLR